jgi:hypothetical protein
MVRCVANTDATIPLSTRTFEPPSATNLTVSYQYIHNMQLWCLGLFGMSFVDHPH